MTNIKGLFQNFSISLTALIILVFTYVSANEVGNLGTIIGLFCGFLINLVSPKEVSSVKKSFITLWFTYLSYISATCISTEALHILFNYVNRDRPPVFSQFLPSSVPNLFSTVALVAVTILFLLGLESSSLFDLLIETCLFVSLILFSSFSVTESIIFSSTKNVFNVSTDDILNKVILGTGSFQLAFVPNSLTKTHYGLNLGLLAIYLLIVGLITVTPSNGCSVFALVCPTSSFFKWIEPTMICLSLSITCLIIPQLFSSALSILMFLSQNRFIGLVKRHLTTGTFSRAILLTGFFCVSLKTLFDDTYSLMLLSNTAVVIGQAIDVIWVINYNYQPSIALNAKDFKIKKKRSYQPVKTAKASSAEDLIDSEDDSLSSTSDSGHSSDTDIDEIVVEYKDKVKVMNFIKLNDPTKWSGLKVTVSLLCIIVINLVSSICSLYGFFLPTILSMFGSTLLTIFINCQPQKVDAAQIPLEKLLRFIFILEININLFVHFFRNTFGVVLAWILTGVLAVLLFTSDKKENSKIQAPVFGPPVPLTMVGHWTQKNAEEDVRVQRL